jgi:small-conductance mechanosensitive channel
MAMAPVAPPPISTLRRRIFGSTRIVTLLVLSALLVVCLVFSWTTNDVMGSLSFLKNQGTSGRGTTRKTLVDLHPWQTAQALAPLAVTAEEKEFASDAERLADHEVDQAFASTLRLARLAAQRLTYTGEALALSQKVTQIQQLIQQDQEQVDDFTQQLSPAAVKARNGAPTDVDEGDLEVAKAQLGLDTDEITDAQRDLDRVSGDQTSLIQAELTAHEATMREYDKRVQSGGQVTAISVKRYGTMAGRIRAWFSQRDRYSLLQQALQDSKTYIGNLTAEHNALEAKVNASMTAKPAVALDRASRLANIKDQSAERQVLSIYDDRIQTEQQLVTVYNKWSAQVLLQHRIVLHLILQSFVLILFIGICMVLLDALVRRLMANPKLDRRRSQTLRSILQLGIQVLGAGLILIVIFGSPQETPTIIGLTTAALTFALQDFILAFLGWFVLIGKNGIHVGDWVEINGVGGEVTEVGLFNTALLEIGTLADKGLPTGRRITFMNGYAIRGQYFNFSTTGQWMWDEITVTVPATSDLHEIVESIHQAVLAETEKYAQVAEDEWKRGSHGASLSKFSAAPVENLRPSGSGIDIRVRYVTRASEKFDLRNRLYQKLIELLHAPSPDTNKQQSAQVHVEGS